MILMNDLSNRGDYLGVELHHEKKIHKYYNEAGYWESVFGRMLITQKSGLPKKGRARNRPAPFFHENGFIMNTMTLRSSLKSQSMKASAIFALNIC